METAAQTLTKTNSTAHHFQTQRGISFAFKLLSEIQEVQHSHIVEDYE